MLRFALADSKPALAIAQSDDGDVIWRACPVSVCFWTMPTLTTSDETLGRSSFTDSRLTDLRTRLENLLPRGDLAFRDQLSERRPRDPLCLHLLVPPSPPAAAAVATTALTIVGHLLHPQRISACVLDSEGLGYARTSGVVIIMSPDHWSLRLFELSLGQDDPMVSLLHLLHAYRVAHHPT